MSFFSQLQQNVLLSAGNSTLTGTNLNANGASGDTFTGSKQSTLGVAGLQINLHTTQNCTIYVDQAMDEVPNWDVTDTFSYYSSKGGMSFTVQATAANMRVRVVNLGSIATTHFRLQTALCPIVEAVPRALSSEGNLKVGVYEIEGDFGTTVEVTPNKTLAVEESCRLVGASFASTFDTNFWVLTTATGTSTATVGSGVLTLATNPTGSGSGNSVIVNSVRTARFSPGIVNYYRGKVSLPAVTGANTRRWGAFNAQDGYYFYHDGTTLKLGYRKAGVDASLISSGSFNGKIGSTYAVDNNVHNWEIFWIIDKVWYFIDGLLLHSVSATTAPLVATPHLQVGMECTNGANTNNNTLVVWIATIRRTGKLHTQPQYGRISTTTTTTLKYGPGNLFTIVFGTLPTTAGTITIYDNTSATGTVIWAGTVFTGTPGGSATPERVPFSIDFNGLPFNNGLTIVTATNAADFTVIYE